MRRRRTDPGRGDSGTGQRGRLERLLLSVMGPPQLGDLSAPPSSPADPALALCHKCAAPWDRHEIVRTSSLTYARCPAPGPAGQP